MSLVLGSPALSRVAGAAPVTPPSFAPTQSFTGGGTGAMSERLYPALEHSGHYTSTGQLGQGLFYWQDAVEPPRAARFTRSDGMTLVGVARKTPGACGSIPITTYCLTMELVGTADIAQARFIVVAQNFFGSPTRPRTTNFLMSGTLTLNRRTGYVMVDARGDAWPFGGIDHFGRSDTHASDIEPTRSGAGYWIVSTAGQVSAFGDAQYHGNARVRFPPDEFVTSMSATPSGMGYWLFTSKGRALPFGDAQFLGDLHTFTLNGGIVGSVATPTGNGYYMVGSDGGVFAFGDARFRGSMGSEHLNQAVVGLVPTPDNAGYWLVAADGGVFSFNARFFGSMGGTRLNRPMVAMVPYGNAYLMVAADGGVFDFARAPFFGSRADAPLRAPFVGAAAVG